LNLVQKKLALFTCVSHLRNILYTVYIYIKSSPKRNFQFPVLPVESELVISLGRQKLVTVQSVTHVY